MIIPSLIVWTAAVICYQIMKKIQPDGAKLYLAYVLFVCIALTVALAWNVF